MPGMDKWLAMSTEGRSSDLDTEKGVEDLEGREALRVAEELVDDHGYHGRSPEVQDGDGPAEYCRPCNRRGCIVRYQIALS